MTDQEVNSIIDQFTKRDSTFLRRAPKNFTTSLNDYLYSVLKFAHQQVESNQLTPSEARQFLTLIVQVVHEVKQSGDIVIPTTQGINHLPLMEHQASFMKKWYTYLETQYQTRKVQQDFVVRSIRQSGKSYLASDIICRFAIEHPDTASFYALPSYEPVYSEVKTYMQRIVPSLNINESKKISTFSNGSSVKFISAERRNQQVGATCTGIMVVDEAALIPLQWFEQVLDPEGVVNRVPRIFISTPRFKSEKNLFYKAWSNPKAILHDFRDFPECIQRLITPEVLEQKRIQLTPAIFRTEYQGEFLSDEGDVFKNIDKVCSLDYYIDEDIYYATCYDPKEDLLLAIDTSQNAGRDFTYISGHSLDGNQKLFWKTNVLPMPEVVKKVEYIRKSHNVVLTVIETNFNSIIDFLDPEALVGHQLGQDKNLQIEDLSIAFSTGTVRMIDEEEQKLQFVGYGGKLNSSGTRVQYNAIDPDVHDDAVMASSLGYRYTKLYNMNYGAFDE